jgi:lysophospholipid acyltransferase (LPLAT)-like uncharacterized protein
MPEVSSAPQSPANPPKKSVSGVVIPHKPRLRQRVAALLISTLVRCVALTVRYRLNDTSGLFASAPRERIIFAIWHNRLALSLMMYRRYVQRRAPERRLAAMVSASRDGGLLTRVLELFNVQPVRGSSSRRGPQALREMVSWAESGYDLAITPDGPRGPGYHVQEGVISTAQLTGLAIVPVSYYLNRKIRAKSWDRFQVPLPFARCDVFVGKPIRVPREASEADREALRNELEQTLRDITRD